VKSEPDNDSVHRSVSWPQVYNSNDVCACSSSTTSQKRLHKKQWADDGRMQDAIPSRKIPEGRSLVVRPPILFPGRLQKNLRENELPQ